MTNSKVAYIIGILILLVAISMVTVRLIADDEGQSEIDANDELGRYGWSILLSDDGFVFEGEKAPPFAKMFVDEKEGVYIFIRDDGTSETIDDVKKQLESVEKEIGSASEAMGK